MKKLLNQMMLLTFAACIVGCGSGEVADGHKSDPTPGGEPNTIEDTSPDALQNMENVGEPIKN
ncbi:MAG TPA: hypothetical protein VMM56_01950 [Planctomycetaceae bacterium]|nr:hypothetical protein [Planctomycetaceae bacterium]